MKKYTKYKELLLRACFVFVALFVPKLVFAQATVDTILGRIKQWVGIATPIIAGIALLAFFWGLMVFIFRAGNEEERTKGKQIMGWGILALFVMFSIWGIVQFIGTSLDIDRNEINPAPPCIQGLPGCDVGGGGSGNDSSNFPST